jgi:hypothetical protein
MKWSGDIKMEQLKSHKLLDTIIREYKLKNDRHLARVLGVSPSSICKIRNGYLTAGPEYVLRVHDCTGWDIKLIKGLL